MIQPCNLSKIADEFINYLGLNAHDKVLLSQNYQGRSLFIIALKHNLYTVSVLLGGWL